MHLAREEQRSQHRHAPPGQDAADNVVRHGLALQSSIGTVGAVEYLKSNGIHSSTIERVLTGRPLRNEDLVNS